MMRYNSKNQGCFKLFLSSLTTAIFLNYLIVGFMDYIHTMNMIVNWVEKSGLFSYIKSFLGIR